MIDPTIFNLERLIDWLLGYSNSNPENIWIRDCNIFKDDKNNMIISHYFWDCYGDNFLTPELALIALSKAPIPYCLIKRS